MVIARSVNETFPYVCIADRAKPPGEQTTFRLRRLPALVALALDNLHDANADGSRVTLRIGDQKKVALLAGLAGWENLNDSEGRPIEFRAASGDRPVCGITVKNPADAAVVDLLPHDVAEELADAVRNGSVFTELDAKK